MEESPQSVALPRNQLPGRAKAIAANSFAGDNLNFKSIR
jgi:hypothetical protein